MAATGGEEAGGGSSGSTAAWVSGARRTATLRLYGGLVPRYPLEGGF